MNCSLLSWFWCHSEVLNYFKLLIWIYSKPLLPANVGYGAYVTSSSHTSSTRQHLPQILVHALPWMHRSNAPQQLEGNLTPSTNQYYYVRDQRPTRAVSGTARTLSCTIGANIRLGYSRAHCIR